MFIKKLIVTLIVIHHASAVVSGDVPYEIFHDKHQEVIFSKEHTQSAEHFKQVSKKLHKEYEKSFGFSLSQKNYTTLASSHNQIANGFATFYPLLYTEFYSGGMSHLDYFGANSWLDELTLHELSHTYQLDAKHGIPTALQTIFGNNGLPFINPNFLLPMIVIEGNAVMNESRAGIGGRLFVGEHRALVYALSHEKRLDHTRLLNNHKYFPYGSEKYLVGGYFWAYLSKRFGTDKANAFFLHHSIHYINPLLINTSFEEHFGMSFKMLIELFLKELYDQSRHMTYAQGELLFKAKYMGRMNTTPHGIAVVYSQEEGSNKLAVVDPKDHTMNIVDSSLSIGKPFYIDDEWYTASQETISNNYVATGLFDKDRKLLKGSKSRHVMAHEKDRFAYFDVKNSFYNAQLFVDETEFGTVNSEAILDAQGNVYYARQEGEVRTLYKNKIPLGSFKGYWSKLMQVKEGTLYFIGSTLYGSSLFALKEGVFTRLSSADNIVEAQLLDDDKIIVKTVTADGYELCITSLESAQKDEPAFYSYALKPNTIFTDALNESQQVEESDPYIPFTNMHFATFLPEYHSSGSSTDILLNLMMQDPLKQNALTLAYQNNYNSSTQKSVNAVQSLYSNSEHLLNYSINLGYVDAESKKYAFGGLGLSYLLCQTAFDNATLTLSAQSDTLSFSNDLTMFETFHYGYGEHYGYAYDWYKHLNVDLGHKLLRLQNSVSVHTAYSQAIVDYLYVQVALEGRYSQNSAVYFGNRVLSLSQDPTDVIIQDRSVGIDVESLYGGSGALKYAMETPFYLDIIPVSIERSALLLGASAFEFKSLTHSATSMYEVNAGVELELLLLHLSVSRFTFFINYNSLTKQTSNSFALGIYY